MKNIFRKKKNGKIYNTDFGLDKILIYDSDKASEFNRSKHYFESWGYKVKKIILCDNGSIKLLAVLKKKVLYRCLLDSQKVDHQDRVRPYGGTHPDYCIYYKDGVCTCVDPKHCLYQETSHHVSIIKDMKTIQKMILIFIIKIVHIMKIQNWEESFLNNMIILMLKIMRIRSNLYIVEVYIEMIEDASRVINSTSSFVGCILICFYCIRRIKFHLSFIQSRCCII